MKPITTYAYLGPAGTFTEAALRQIANDSDVLVPYSNVTAALDAVRSGKATAPELKSEGALFDFEVLELQSPPPIAVEQEAGSSRNEAELKKFQRVLDGGIT